MTKQQADEIREKLLEQRSELVQEVASLRDEDAFLKMDPGSELAERAALEAERALVHRHEWDDVNLLRKINLALERLDNGTYETCLSCGEKIPMERLLAKPAVALCVTCQKAKDEGK